MSSAFTRTRTVMARHDVAPALLKWWKAHSKDDGLVTRHLSPYEQQAIMPWLRTFPQLAYKKFVRSVPYWGGAGALVGATIVYGDAADDAADRAHRF